MTKRLLIMALLIIVHFEGQAQTVVEFSFDKSAPEPGEMINISVVASERFGLAGGQFEIHFNTEFLSLADDPQPAEAFQNTTFLSNTTDEGVIKVSFAGTETLFQAGEGPLFSFTLQSGSKALGETVLIFEDANLFYPLGEPVPLEAENKSFFIRPFQIEPLMAPELIMRYEFAERPLSANGWSELPGGFTSQATGEVSLMDFETGLFETSRDDQGLAFAVGSGEVVMLFAGKPISSASGPFALRMNVRADNGNASIWLVALKGDLAQNTNVDGSIAMNNPMTSNRFVDKEGRLVLVYEPDEESVITPIIQVAGGQSDGIAHVWIDRLEIFQIDPSFYGIDP